jgi:hypothetical protein
MLIICSEKRDTIVGEDQHCVKKSEQAVFNFIKHFWRWELIIEPKTHVYGGTQANPSCRSYSSLSDQGDANAKWELQTWTSDTVYLEPCGYTLRLIAYDRTIIDSNSSLFHRQEKFVGFSVV